ncbi:MAG: CotH kinase family protein, partial [Planctomycetota bacterium]
MLRALEFWSVVSLVSFVGVALAECPKGDLSGDCRVDFKDVRILAGQWLYSSDFPADLDGLNGVEWRDFALIARTWGKKGIPLVINEFMASNSGGDLDPQGQDDDWIEIYNAGDEAIDMAGMYLTNNLDNPEKWRIPDVFSRLTTIQPGGHLIIWADIDEEDYPAGLHASFRIDAGGGELGLFDSNSAILIDKVDFPDQTPNISYGRFPDGNEVWQFFAFPTHRATNIGAYLGTVADTKFSHNRGFYDEPFSVTLATDTEDANIYYTLDGSSPWDVLGQFPKGSLYTGAIPITTTTCLRAVAFKPGYKTTNVDAQTYIFLDDVRNQPANPPGFPSGEDYGMDPDIVNSGVYGPQIRDALLSLPTVSIATDMGNLFGPNGIYTNQTADWVKPTSVELIYPDGREGFNVSCGIKIFGGASRNMSDKYSFRLLFRGAYGPTRLRYAWFGEDAADDFDTISLRGGFNDGYGWSAASDQVQYIRDEFLRRLQADTGHASPHGTFVHLYLNGLYWGLYNPCERPDGSFSASYYGGDKHDWDSFSHRDFEIHDGDRTALNLLLTKCRAGLSSNEAYQEIQGNNPDGTRNPAYPHLIDIPNYIDYMIVNLWSGNEDWPWNNYWLTRKRTSDSTGFKFFCWDSEISMDNYRTSLTFDRTEDYRQVAEMQGRLKANAEYGMLFADHVHKHLFNNGLMTPASLIPRYQKLAREVELAMIAESARWGDMHHNPPLTQQQWKIQRDDVLNTFLVQRTGIALQQFKNVGLYPNVEAPLFYVNGSPKHGCYISGGDLLSMSNPNSRGTVYYTLDGSDPRLPGGAVNSAHEIAYSDPIDLTHSTRVKARVTSG